MVVSTSGRHDVSPHQLARWGLWHQVQREECIDHLLDEIEQPDASQLKVLQEQWLQAHELPNQQALQGWLHQQDLDQADWTELITRPWRWQQWCHGHFKDQLSTYYLKRKPLLDRVSYSLLRVKDKALATELYLRIKEGKPPLSRWPRSIQPARSATAADNSARSPFSNPIRSSPGCCRSAAPASSGPQATGELVDCGATQPAPHH